MEPRIRCPFRDNETSAKALAKQWWENAWMQWHRDNHRAPSTWDMIVAGRSGYDAFMAGYLIGLKEAGIDVTPPGVRPPVPVETEIGAAIGRDYVRRQAS